MASVSAHHFPSPIGGAPFPIDFAPSMLFSILHALLVPIFAWRIARWRTRQFVLIGILVFTIERWVIPHVLNASLAWLTEMRRSVLYALRAYAAHNVGARTNESLETYLQTTLAGGFVSIGMSLMQLTRSLLVNATKGSEVLVMEAKENKTKKPDFDPDTSVTVEVYTADLEDHPHMRALIRRMMLSTAILFWTTIIMGIVAGVDYQNAIHSGAHADLVRQLWYKCSPSIICISVF